MSGSDGVSIPGSPFGDADLSAAARLIARLTRAGKRVATAESCTGGLIAGLLTAVPGSSGALEAGFVTYSNAAKTRLLGVPEALVADYGAVSAPVAAAMAEGALARTGADLAIAATGVAGPGGGSTEKPVGLVYLGLAAAGRPAKAHALRLDGDRGRIRLDTVRRALALLEDATDP
jgi:nicotinamide-nucleotide amidase